MQSFLYHKLKDKQKTGFLPGNNKTGSLRTLTKLHIVLSEQQQKRQPKDNKNRQSKLKNQNGQSQGKILPDSLVSTKNRTGKLRNRQFHDNKRTDSLKR